MSINGPSILGLAIGTCIVTLKARWHFYRRYNFSRAADWFLEDSHSPVDTFSQTVLVSLIFAVCQSCSCHFIIIFFYTSLPAFTSLVFFCFFFLRCITVIDPVGHNPLCGPKKMLYSLYGKKIKLLCGEGWWECQAMWDPHSPVTGSSLEGSHLPDTICSPPTRPNWSVSPSPPLRLLLSRTQCPPWHPIPPQASSYWAVWKLQTQLATLSSWTHMLFFTPTTPCCLGFPSPVLTVPPQVPEASPYPSIFSFLNWGVPKACSRPFPFLNP